MGDRELNKAPKVTDMAYVPVVMADGSIGQIAKADLASVVAGLMGLNTYYYKRKGSVLSTDELNSIFDGGDIYVADTITGVSSRFLIQSYRFGGVSCFQKAIDIDNAYNTYVRETANDGVSWTDWKRTDNFGYNSLAELAAALKPLL